MQHGSLAAGALPPSIPADVLSGGVPLCRPTRADRAVRLGRKKADARRSLRDPEGRRQSAVFATYASRASPKPGFRCGRKQLSDRDGKPFCASATRSLRPVQTDPMPADIAPAQAVHHRGSNQPYRGQAALERDEVNPALDATLFYLPQPVGIPTDPDPLRPGSGCEKPMSHHRPASIPTPCRTSCATDPLRAGSSMVSVNRRCWCHWYSLKATRSGDPEVLFIVRTHRCQPT